MWCDKFNSKKTLDDVDSTTSEGLCRWSPVGLPVRLKLGVPFDRGHVEIHGCDTHITMIIGYLYVS